MTKKLDPEYVHQFMLDERRFRLTEPYQGANIPMKGVCLTCGEKGSPTWSNIQKGKGACGTCSGSKRKPLDPAYVRNKLIHEKLFYPTEPYVNARTPMKGVCLTCGEEGVEKWSKGAGACKNCAGNKPLDPAYVRREMIKTYNFLPIEQYVNSGTPMRGICLVCKSPGAPTWNNVNKGKKACNGKCKKKGMKYSLPAVVYLVGGYVKDAGPSLKVGIAEAQREKGRLAEHKKTGLDTHLASIHFSTGYEAKAFENELKDLIWDGPNSFTSRGIIFDGSTETFPLGSASPEFLRDLLGRFGITDVFVPSGLWMEENFRSRFEVWSSLAA